MGDDSKWKSRLILQNGIIRGLIGVPESEGVYRDLGILQTLDVDILKEREDSFATYNVYKMN